VDALEECVESLLQEREADLQTIDSAVHESRCDDETMRVLIATRVSSRTP
jgi:hypothetical protein